MNGDAKPLRRKVFGDARADPTRAARNERRPLPCSRIALHRFPLPRRAGARHPRQDGAGGIYVNVNQSS